MSNYIEIINGKKHKIALIGDIVGTSDVQTLTYKSIDCDYNTISNITPSNIKTSALAIGVSNNDQLTTKGYVNDLISLNLTSYIKLQGDWDAINNNPDITGTTEVGFAWKVYNASTGSPNTNTVLDGISDWKDGDLAVKTSSGWMLIKGDSISLTWGSITGSIINQTDLSIALNSKLNSNVSITAGQHTKITYDSNGLVTSGTDLVWGDISGSVTNQTDLIEYFNDIYEVKGQLDSLHNLGLYQGDIEDLGMHWVQTATTFADIQGIYHVKHLEQGIVLAGSYGGPDGVGLRVYRSTDYGLTFPTTIQLSTSLSDTNDNGTTFQILYLQNGIVLIGGYHSGHSNLGFTYRSTDYGLTWTNISMPVAVKGVQCYCDIETGNVLAGCNANNSVFKSSDNGATWSIIGTMGTTSSDGIQTISYLGSNTTQQILIGGSLDNNVYKSVNGGVTWISCFTATSGINCSSYFGNGVVVVGTEDGTLYRSHDYGTTWVAIGGNRSIRFITYVGSGVAFYTTSFSATLFKTIDNGSHWFEVTGAFFDHSFGLKLSYAGNGLMFAATGDASGGTARVLRSTIYEPITHPIFNGIRYTYPTSNVSGVLTNDGSGNLTWGTIPAPDLSTLMVKTANLSDVTDRQTSIDNLTAVSSASDGQILRKSPTTHLIEWAYPGAGTNFSRTFYIDSVNGVDESLAVGRGQSSLPYKTIDYVLTKIDDNTIVTNRIITGCTTTNANSVITVVSDTSNVEIGQYITGTNIPYNTVVINKTSNTITLSKNATASGTGISITLWYNNEINCQGSFVVTGSINRNAVTFNTTSFAKLSASSVIITHYTDTNNYKIPCQTLKGNWDILITGTAQFIKYDFTSDIGITDVDSNFYDEWNKFYSNISGNAETTSSISYKSTVANYAKVSLKYNSSISKNGLFFWNNYAYGASLYVDQQYTYGLQGCFISSSSYGFKYLYISPGIVECPSGVYALYFGYTDGFYSNHKYDCLVSSGDVYALADTLVFTGSIMSAFNCYIGSSNTRRNVTILGEIFATNIYTFTGNFIGGVHGNVIISGANVILNNFTGSITQTIAADTELYGNFLSDDFHIVSLTNGTINVRGKLYTNSGYNFATINGGTLVLDCDMYNPKFSILLQSGKLITTPRLYSNNVNYAFVTQSGGVFIHKGTIKMNATGVPCIEKSAGTLQIEGGKLLTYDTSTNPIKITANTSAAKEIRIFSAITNCDGITNSILNQFDGGSYSPNDIVGGDIFENTVYL